MSLFNSKLENSEIKAEISIYNTLRNNQITLWAMIGFVGIISISAFIFSYNIYSYQMNHTLILNEKGENVPLEWIERRTNIEVELKQNVSVWVHRFYNYDYMQISNAFSNDDAKKQSSKLELASWMIKGDLFTKYKKVYNQWWNDVTRNNITQTAEIEEGSLMVGNIEPYLFKANLLITVSKGEYKEYYRQPIAGKMTLTSRDYPKNPHGFLIVAYKEGVREKLEDYEQQQQEQQ